MGDQNILYELCWKPILQTHYRLEQRIAEGYVLASRRSTTLLKGPSHCIFYTGKFGVYTLPTTWFASRSWIDASWWTRWTFCVGS